MGEVVENEIEEPNVKRAKQSENNEDRLSDLPDCVLIHLMSFVPTKDAVRTCVLSRRWKNLWKRLPTLILHSSHFGLKALFNKFVPKVLSFRDDSVPVHHFDFYANWRVPPQLVKSFLSYVLSHNVQRLKLAVNCNIYLPPGLFFCQTLTSLDLSVFNRFNSFPTSLNLPALTSLRLYNFVFGDSELLEPFSSCTKLMTLVIHNCDVMDTQTLCISNATLVNLTVHDSTHQAYSLVLSTPNLCSFVFSGVPAQQISGSLHSWSLSVLSLVKEVNIDVDDWFVSSYLESVALKEENINVDESPYLETAFTMNCWLQVFANVTTLTLSSSTLQIFSIISDYVKMAPSMSKLMSLIVKVKKPPYQKPQKASKSRKAQLKPYSPVPEEVVDYLIQDSPSVGITIIDSQSYLKSTKLPSSQLAGVYEDELAEMRTVISKFEADLQELKEKREHMDNMMQTVMSKFEADLQELKEKMEHMDNKLKLEKMEKEKEKEKEKKKQRKRKKKKTL
ncbi:F-box protein At1g60400-like isoform X2 [Gastrolobium bilobum]|uniref:F-box protein At1g60400-like isoform X2 n=1 Tax=Gastrolobium bilobum TaxID=150636 RepID=UPI002AB267FD|nr:F-box protein At1g60400-like isoform X2 [Gastrolobium bilobum]